MILRRTTTLLFALASVSAGAAHWSQAAAQARDIDSEASTGKVYKGEFSGSDFPQVFHLTLAADQAAEVMAVPVGGSDPYLRVFDDASGDLLAENDDALGTAAQVRLYSATRKRVRIEVSPSPGSSVGSPRFTLMVVPSDYRPKPVVPIALGEQHGGQLGAQEEQLFRFRGEAGQAWEFSMIAAEGSSLDPALEIYAGEVASGTALASDDDGGGLLNSRLRFAVPRRGTYTVRAHAIGSSTGDYTFSAGAAVIAPPATLDTLDLGSSATNSLDSDTPERLYQLSADARRGLLQAEGTLIIEMKSVSGTPFDPVVDVGFETPLGFSSVVTDDDSGENGNARLVVDLGELAQDSDWLETLRIKARSFSGSEGTYELSVVRAAAE